MGMYNKIWRFIIGSPIRKNMKIPTNKLFLEHVALKRGS